VFAPVDPVPWECPDLSLPVRLWETLRTAAHPLMTAPAIAHGPANRAPWFAIATILPLGALRGVIPLTHTLMFVPGFGITLVGMPSVAEVAVDIGRAMALSLAVSLVSLAALALPYVSLSRAYGASHLRDASVRLVLYRGFLLAVSSRGICFWLAVWGAPASASELVVTTVFVLEFLPLFLFFIAMYQVARMGHGVGPFASVLVVVVPLVLMEVTQLLLLQGLAELFPVAASSGPPPP
jgi:hypothetical protein